MVCHLKNKTASRTKNIIELLVVNMTVYLQEKRITKLSNLRKNLLKEKIASLKELPSLIPNRKLDFPYIKQSFWHLFIANATNFEVTRDFILGRQSRTDTSSTGRTEMGVEQSETKQEENYPTL